MNDEPTCKECGTEIVIGDQIAIVGDTVYCYACVDPKLEWEEDIFDGDAWWE